MTVDIMSFVRNSKVFVAITAIIWISFIVTSVGATTSLRDSFKSKKDVDALSSITIPKLQKLELPLSEADYSRILANHIPDGIVSVENMKKAITISAKSIDDYQKWKSTLSIFLSSSEADFWRVDSICLGDCGGSVKYSASIVGVKTLIRETK